MIINGITLINSLNILQEPISDINKNIVPKDMTSEFSLLIKNLINEYKEHNDEESLQARSDTSNKEFDILKESIGNENVGISKDIKEEVLSCIAYVLVNREFENNNFQLTGEVYTERVQEDVMKDSSKQSVLKTNLYKIMDSVINDSIVSSAKVNEIVDSKINIYEKIGKIYEFALENANTESLKSVKGVKILEKVRDQLKQFTELFKQNSEDIVLVETKSISDKINKEITANGTHNLMEEISLSKEVILNYKSQEKTNAKEEIKASNINPNNISTNNLLTDNINEIKQEVFITKKNIAANMAEVVNRMVETEVKEITVKVIPRNLGEITIKASKADNGLNLEIILSKKESLNLLNNNIAQIEKLLEIKHLDISGIMLSLGNYNSEEKNSDDAKRNGKQKAVISKPTVKTSISTHNVINSAVSSHSIDELA